MHKAARGFFLVAALAVGAASAARDEARTIAVQEDQVTSWNRFADQLLAMHRQQLAGRKIRETEEFGGYANLPRFYREVSYYDADSGRLLSRIQWETAQPERVHTIEVYVYEANGRLARDYMAWFLPRFRNAPRATTVNLYHYGRDVRGWRQFDASGNHIYERCDSRQGDQVGKTLLEFDDIALAKGNAAEAAAVQNELYLRCFGDLRASAGPHLTPH
jgi:hypothetical protein